MSNVERFLVLIGVCAVVELVLFGPALLISYMHRRAYRKPVQFVPPLAVAKLHLASKWRRDRGRA